MTDQPYTPTLDSALDEIATILARFRSSKESIRAELDQMITQVEAAAEQRGNLDGWDEALELLENNSEIDQDAVDHYKSLNPNRINRADQMERDE